jgi:hypothetical protein
MGWFEEGQQRYKKNIKLKKRNGKKYFGSGYEAVPYVRV